MSADDLAIDLPDILEVGEILLLVGQVPRHGRDVLGLRTGLGQHVDDVLQRLPDLADEVMAFEPVLVVPADLAADEDQLAFGGDTVGVTLGLRPPGRLQGRVRCHGWFLNWKRWILPVWVLGNAAMNFTERGYL